MAKLLDLPEELLSSICEMADQSSMFPLATSCKLFNRLAGWRYVRLIDKKLRSLDASDVSHSEEAYGWTDLRNASRILRSVSQIQLNISCNFSSEYLLREMKLLARILQRVQVDLSSLTLNFSGNKRAELFPNESLYYPNALCAKAFNDIIGESVEGNFLHVVSVGIKEFYISTHNGVIEPIAMLSWGCKVFPNAHTLILNDCPENTRMTSALLAEILSRRWRSIKTLVINSKSESMEAWRTEK